MKIVVNNFQIEKVLDDNNNQIESETLMGTPYWDIYNITEALLYHHVKRYDVEKNQSFNFYPYRKRFKELYGDSNFIVDLIKDIRILKTINAPRIYDRTT